eukprot:7101487-Prymnesium_polylepis.1
MLAAHSLAGGILSCVAFDRASASSQHTDPGVVLGLSSSGPSLWGLVDSAARAYDARGSLRE